MKSNNIIIAHPTTEEQFAALKALMRALKIKFEVTQEDRYNPAFVEKIIQGKKEIAEGKGIRMTLAELKEICK